MPDAGHWPMLFDAATMPVADTAMPIYVAAAIR